MVSFVFLASIVPCAPRHDTGPTGIRINRLTSPPTADARFRGVVHYEPRAEWLHQRYYAANFIAKLRLEGDRWLITDHVEISEIGSAGPRP